MKALLPTLLCFSLVLGNLSFVQAVDTPRAQGGGAVVDSSTARGAENDLADAMVQAADRGDALALGTLIAKGAPVDALDSRGWTPLIVAVQKGHADAARRLIAAGADIERRTTNAAGSSVLCFALKGGNMAIVQDLLDRGADVNGKSRNGMTPLCYAAVEGQLEQARFLISKGAELDLCGLIDSRGASLSPLMMAAMRTNSAMVELLLKAGANLEATNNRGDTALMEIAKRPHPDSVKLLIAKGANVNATGPRGHTALIYAAFNGMVRNIEALLAAGADPFATATDSNKPGYGSWRYGAADLARQERKERALAIILGAQDRAAFGYRVAIVDLGRFFTAHGVKGTFVLLDSATSSLTIFDSGRAQKRFIPASTFKIANTLIGIDAGVVKDVDEVLPYGGKTQPFKQWEHDMPLREAMKLSAVPIYQELARRIGAERMKAGLKALEYGNQEIGTAVDRFWLDGPLTISAVEQVRFLDRLVQRKLPISGKAVDAVQEITLQERAADHELHYKTGWVFGSDPQIGWIVGWVNKGDSFSVFALNMDMAGEEDAPKRWLIARECLGHLGALK